MYYRVWASRSQKVTCHVQKYTLHIYLYDLKVILSSPTDEIDDASEQMNCKEMM